METFLFFSVVAIFVLMNAFDVYTRVLNHKARTRPIPENVQDVYDEESYKQWLAYSGEHERIGFVRMGISFAVVLVLLVTGVFARLAEFSAETSDSVYLETLVFFGILAGASGILSFIFRYYKTFSIEERYGFNRTTKRTFFRDRLISLILSALLGGGLLLLVQSIYLRFDAEFLLVAFVAVMAVFAFLNLFGVKLFLPLFNKLTPLEEGELRNRIEALAQSENYEIKKISVMDASKRSSKLNAFFSGFSRFKNVVLFDTLYEKMNDDEILAVLAHEIAHSKHKDVLKRLFFSAVTLAIMLLLLYLFLSWGALYQAFGLEEESFAFGVLLFSIVVHPVALAISVFENAVSRKAEFKADAFAAKKAGKEPMQSALKVLACANYSNLTPHPFYVFLHYSHPPIDQRVGALETHS